MKIYYQDEYGEELYVAYNKNAVPRIGETVVLVQQYRVKDVIWDAASDDVIVEVTQNLIRASKEISNDNTSGRLTEMNRAIVALGKRQDTAEKKSRMLTEQVVTVRKHINQRIQQERKES